MSGPICCRISDKLSALLKILLALNNKQRGKNDDISFFRLTSSSIGFPGLISCPGTGVRFIGIGSEKALSSVS